MSYLTNQILRGAETIRRNSSEEWKERAEKAEAKSESCRVALVAMIKANNKLEAEVERLREIIESL